MNLDIRLSSKGSVSTDNAHCTGVSYLWEGRVPGRYDCLPTGCKGELLGVTVTCLPSRKTRSVPLVSVDPLYKEVVP